MKTRWPIATKILISFLILFSGCYSGPTEEDIIGEWRSTHILDLKLEFFPDMTSTVGYWSITRDGHIEIAKPDGAKYVGELKDGVLTFPGFGAEGIFVKEDGKTDKDSAYKGTPGIKIKRKISI